MVTLAKSNVLSFQVKKQRSKQGSDTPKITQQAVASLEPESLTTDISPRGTCKSVETDIQAKVVKANSLFLKVLTSSLPDYGCQMHSHKMKGKKCRGSEKGM